MTSWVISIFLRSTPPFGSSERNGTSDPKASECMTTRTYGSRPAARERSKRSRSVVERGGPLLVVGRVHVDVDRLGARGLDRRLDLLDVGERRPEVEMDPAMLVAGLRERDGGRLPHPGRSPQDERPALAVVGHRVSPPWVVGSGGIGSGRRRPSLAAARGRLGPSCMQVWPDIRPLTKSTAGRAMLAAMNDSTLLLLLTPLIVIQLGLIIFALHDLIRPERKVKGDSKLMWGIIICVVGMIGPILYLIVGREER